MRGLRPAVHVPEPSAAAAPVREMAATTMPSTSIAPLHSHAAPPIYAARPDNEHQRTPTTHRALTAPPDLAPPAQLDGDAAREELRHIVNEIIPIKNIVMSIPEQE